MDFAMFDQILTVTVWRILLVLGGIAIGIQIGWSIRKRLEKHPIPDLDQRLPPPPRVPSFDRGLPSHEAERISTIPPDEEVDIRDLEPIRQLEVEGFRCEQLDEEDFSLRVAGDFNFAEAEDIFACKACRTDQLPYAVWGTADTTEDGLVGYFCECGNGFVVTCDEGKTEHQPSTIFQFLRPDSPCETIKFPPLKRAR